MVLWNVARIRCIKEQDSEQKADLENWVNRKLRGYNLELRDSRRKEMEEERQKDV